MYRYKLIIISGILSTMFLPGIIFADYGYFTMPVDPSSLSYSNGNAGINSWVDHTSPQGQGDTSSTMTRYDGVQFFGDDASLAHCVNGVGCYNGHEGIDYAVASGISVLAAASGTVKQAEWQDPNNTSTGFGIFERIWHSQYSVSTLYAHLSTTTAAVGNNVKRKQVIASSGCTGICGGPHLHFQVYNANDTVTSTNSFFIDGVDPYGWATSTYSDPWTNDNQFGYMWTSPLPYATSSVITTTTPANITGTTTWLANQEQIIDAGTKTVAATATLIIQPGAVVKFASSSQLIVKGQLDVRGTASSPVYFTSLKDDTVGGDANDDATTTSPGKGDWTKPIEFDAGSSNTISNAVFSYGGNGSLGEEIDAIGGSLTLTNVTVASSSNYGVYVDGTTATVTISNSTIRDNTASGAYGNSGNLTISNSTFSGNGGYPAIINLNNAISFTPSGNTATGTTVGFDVFGVMVTSTTWFQDLPYLPGNTEVASGTTLTINPGTIVKPQLGARIFVDANAKLMIQGTSTNPTYYTSIKDNSLGGTSSGSTTSTPAKGDWQYIRSRATGASTTIDNTFMRYGGSVSLSSNPSIYMDGGQVTVTNTEIASSSGSGIEMAGGNLKVSSSTIRNNANYGVYSTATSSVINIDTSVMRKNSRGIYITNVQSCTVSSSTFANNTTDGFLQTVAPTSTATNNWWNASSGPTNTGNPGGSGDKVSSFVSYNPWSTSQVP